VISIDVRARSSALSLSAAALLLSSFAPFAATAAFADDQAPGPGVARISLVKGDVGVRHDDAGETVAAVLNAPLVVGDYLTTGDAGSDAELQVDGATLIRVGYSTQLRFAKLDSGERVAQVAQGTVEERVLPGGTPIVIDAPSISIRPLGPGAYRLGVGDDGSSQVTVRSGKLDILSPQGEQTVTAGHSVNASGDTDKPQIDVIDAIAKDDFDSFNEQRDGVAKAVASQPDRADLPPAAASDDYAQYGQWIQDPTYGQVWAPTEPPGWAPYTDGQWAWEGGYGWTWVAAEPWGWGPYHYGRWFFTAAYGWCWYPPPVAVVPVWSPALVGFIGFGGGVGVGVASIGWVPLGPREPFVPWYGWSGGVFGPRTVVNNVTVTNVTYINRRFAVQVPVDHWQAGNFAHPVRIAAADWQNAQPVRGALPVVPTRANLRYGNKPVAPELARAPVTRARFAALAAPVKTASFRQVRAALQAHVASPDRPMGEHPATDRPAASEGRSPAATTSRPAYGSSAWDKFDRTRGGGVPVTDGAASSPAKVEHGFTDDRTPDAYRNGTSSAPGAGHPGAYPGQYRQNWPPAKQPPSKAKPTQKKDAPTKKP